MEYLFKRFAKYYDLIYQIKDYKKETDFLLRLIKKNGIKGKEILEVGCGTGNHAVILQKKGFRITGVDLNKEMLAVARKKTKKIRLDQGDMRNFRLKKKFDIVLCLFSTICYNLSYRQMEKTIRNFHRHLKKGGLMIFDMGFNRERFNQKSHAYVNSQSNKEVDIVRFSKSIRKGNYAFLDMAYILFKNKKFHFGSEVHKLGIFDTLKIKRIAEKIGFDVKLYEYSGKPWTKKSKQYVVFAGVKR